VFNLRWGILPALFALLVSIMLGTISGAGFGHTILRAFVFAAVFFGLGLGMWFIVNAYFPEILTGALQDNVEKTGSRVNITIDNSTGEYAVPELYKTAGKADELGNIEDLISGAFKVHSESVDRNQEEGYNEVRVQNIPDDGNIDFQDIFQDAVGFDNKPLEGKSVFTPSFADDNGDLGGLPDLDAMALAFSSGGESSGGSSPVGNSGSSKWSSSGFGGVSDDFKEADFPSSHYAGNKPQPLKGDFNPKELAEGIRTILSKDK